jgi:peptidoglycan hydrolase-like protein with peptidoglycan-binding domain
VQVRLLALGHELGEEEKQGVFGPLTAQAVAAFRELAQLAPGSDVDRDTWAALVDATFTLGDRLLYLRIPYFHGQDVRTLQTALAALGFSCTADGIFGGHTERAVREFQHNAGIEGDGIVGDSTFSAIKRLRHAWEGKEQLGEGVRPLGFARAAEVLESTPVCLFGLDETGCGVAVRMSNLALATTPSSRVTNAQTPEQVPDDAVLVVRLTGDPSVLDERGFAPQVVYDSDETLNARVTTAVGLISGRRPRITVLINTGSQEGEKLSVREEQHAAVVLLDALCLAHT